MQAGRPLPSPELLRPSLDPGLPGYVPTPGLAVKASLRAGSSDVLPTLVEAWVTAFQRYHPGFDLTIERPLAGSLGALELIKGNLDLVFVSRELKRWFVADRRSSTWCSGAYDHALAGV